MNLTEATATDISVLKDHLCRIPRGLAGVAARCGCGSPLVVATAPRLDNGEPFPTTFYLSHPAIVRAVSRIEAQQVMEILTQTVANIGSLSRTYARAHANYISCRNQIGAQCGCGDVAEIVGISAGGMPERVKCLHALVGHALAVGRGMNPIGDWALDTIEAASVAPKNACLCVRSDATNSLSHGLPTAIAEVDWTKYCYGEKE